MTSEALLPGVQVEGDGRVKWFQPFGSVERRDDGVSHVYIGGVLIGSFRGPGERNVLLVQLAEEPRIRMGDLAAAFGVSTEVVRRARRAYEVGGIEAVATAGKAGAPPKVTPELRERAFASFARGCTVTETAKALRKHLSYGTVWKLGREWQAEQILGCCCGGWDATGQRGAGMPATAGGRERRHGATGRSRKRDGGHRACDRP